MSDIQHEPTDLKSELAILLTNLQGNVVVTRQDMESIGEHLSNLWTKAAEADDETALTMITEVWERTQSMAEANQSLATQAVAGGRLAQAAIGERDAYRDNLHELEDALTEAESQAYSDHPKLAGVIRAVHDAVEDEFEESLEEWLYPEAMADAFEELRLSMIDKMRDLTGCTAEAADAFTRVIMGRRAAFSQYQLEMFATLLVSFEATREVVR